MCFVLLKFLNCNHWLNTTQFHEIVPQPSEYMGTEQLLAYFPVFKWKLFITVHCLTSEMLYCEASFENHCCRKKATSQLSDILGVVLDSLKRRISCQYKRPPRSNDLTIKLTPGFIPFTTGWGVGLEQDFHEIMISGYLVNPPASIYDDETDGCILMIRFDVFIHAVHIFYLHVLIHFLLHSCAFHVPIP